MKSLICVYTNQAAAASMDDYAFYSGQFSNCSPLFAFNKQSKLGAFYHVPGKEGGDFGEIENQICKGIVEYVNPDEIWLFPPGGNDPVCQGVNSSFGMRMIPSDQDKLFQIFSALNLSRTQKHKITLKEEAWMHITVSLSMSGTPTFQRGAEGNYNTIYDPKLTGRRGNKTSEKPPNSKTWRWKKEKLDIWNQLSDFYN